MSGDDRIKNRLIGAQERVAANEKERARLSGTAEVVHGGQKTTIIVDLGVEIGNCTELRAKLEKQLAEVTAVEEALKRLLRVYGPSGGGLPR